MRNTRKLLSSLLLCLLIAAAAASSPVGAIGSQKNPQSATVGMEGTIQGKPPSTPATIATPGNGQAVGSTPITVAGLCKTGLLVKVFSNNVFIGSAQCDNGSYSLKVDLFSGANDLVARVFDALDQSGPDSNVVRVTFNDAQFAQFGTRVTLTSNYARRGANPGSTLTWPIALSGGRAPYAVSIGWGDNKPADLVSKPFAGTFNITHIYDSAGVYNVVIKATDANGVSAYLQLVGVGTGQVSGVANAANKTSGGNTTIVQTKVLWLPVLLALPLMLVAFWLGRRHELFTIRRRLEENRLS
ncbi:MAG TPA: hypothetical protein VFL85_02275 [Candidatus Saccharimonadales bacterium]|nr:hypothetical protein [Candidatus Saccharimonadales bacterium]